MISESPLNQVGHRVLGVDSAYTQNTMPHLIERRLLAYLWVDE